MVVHSDRAAVSIVCVYNDAAVLDSCLARSVRAGSTEAPDTELIAVDNRAGAFSTAGGALNDGARRARNDVVVFVHQDVVLHSLVAIERAAALLLRSPGIGIIGAVGMDGAHAVIGRMRDRVVQTGESAPEPRDVDSVDEVLFMIRREQVLAEPLAEDSILAWHAYGVEYCLRVRRSGLRATAMDLPLTHNSLTVNLDKLDLAHRRVGDDYPEFLPIHTTCGIVYGGDGPGGILKAVRRRRGAAIWWNESLTARAIAKRTDSRQVVLADIRLVIDEAATRGGKTGIRVLDVASAADFDESVSDLVRFGIPFSVQDVTVEGARAALETRAEEELVLVAGLEEDDLSRLPLDGVPHVIGHTRDTGLWMLVGVDPDILAPLWGERRNLPFGGLFPRGSVTPVATSR